MKKGFDLSKLGKADDQYLVKQQDANQKKKEKIGRPMTGEEPLSKKVTVNFSETELKKIYDKANGIPCSKYIRDILKNANVI